MKFFSIEWLDEGQVTIEHDDGTTLQGDPAELLPPLLGESQVNATAFAPPAFASGASSHGAI